MKNKTNKKFWKILTGVIGVGAICCIIPTSIVSCSKVDTTSSSETTNTISSVSNQWTTNFSNLENSTNFQTYVNKWLNVYTNDLSSNFALFAKNWVNLTNAKLPSNLDGYVSSSFSTTFQIPEVNSSTKKTNNVDETTTLYYKVEGANLVANSLKENSNHEFNFSIIYHEDYELIINSNLTTSEDINSGIKSVGITANYQDVEFSPTVLGNLDDLLNSNNTNVQVNGGWYLSNGNVSFTSSIFDSNATLYTVNFDKTTNPTNNNWISSPAICSPLSMMWTKFLVQASSNDDSNVGNAIKYQLNNSLWYTHFQNAIISGNATDLNSDLDNLASIANPNINLLDQLKKDSLNIIYPDPNMPTSSSTSSSSVTSSTNNNESTSQQIDQLENKIQSKLDSLSPLWGPIKTKIEDEIKQAIASGNSSTLLSSLQTIWTYLQNI